EGVTRGSGDAALNLFVAMADEQGVGTAITLTTSGGMVTGDLVGIEEYFRLLGGLLSGGDSESATAKSFDRIGDEVRASVEAEGGPSDFVHLRNARFLSGTALVPTPPAGMLWRGSLSAVQGFSIGSLE